MFKWILSKYESGRKIRELQAQLRLARLENELLAEINEALRRNLLNLTAAAVATGDVLGVPRTKK